MLMQKAEVQEEVHRRRSVVDKMIQDLPEQVTNKGRLRLLQSLQRIHDLEADKLQLHLTGKVGDAALASKDCIIERLLRQLRFRDTVIEEQRLLLQARCVTPPEKLEQMYEGLKFQRAGRLTPLLGVGSGRDYPLPHIVDPPPTIALSPPHHSLADVGAWVDDQPVDLQATFTVNGNGNGKGLSRFAAAGRERSAATSPDHEDSPEDGDAGETVGEGSPRQGGRSEYPLGQTMPLGPQVRQGASNRRPPSPELSIGLSPDKFPRQAMPAKDR